MTGQTANSALTQEQIQLMLQLETIFMPHARRQRDEAYEKLEKLGTTDEQLRFVHYTSAEAALSIIRSKRIWMRNATCMSDYREVQHGFDIVNKFFSDKAKLDTFIVALDACVPNAAREAITLFDQWWKDIRLSTYVTSMSEHDSSEDLNGRLSMWRGIRSDTVRVAIVFQVPKISAASLVLNLLFSPIAYLTEDEVHGVIHQVIRNISTDSDFLCSLDRQIVVQAVFYMFVAAVTCLKHEGFREEREWRAIYTPKMRPSPLMESSTEIVAGVPQVVYKIPLDITVSPVLGDLDFSRIFRRLIIGPSSYPWVLFEAFTGELTKAGVKDASERVWNSNIPLRT